MSAENLADTRETLNWIVTWAYEHGVHEMGYDPIAAFELAVRSDQRARDAEPAANNDHEDDAA